MEEVVRHQGPVLQLASCLRDGRLPCELEHAIHSLADRHVPVFAIVLRTFFQPKLFVCSQIDGANSVDVLASGDAF